MRAFGLIACLLLSLLIGPASSQTARPLAGNDVSKALGFTPPYRINAVDFGAKCDGSTDDTLALTNWAAAIVAYSVAELPDGQCVFKSPITFPYVSHVNLIGHATRLYYSGSTTTGSLLVIGHTISNCSVADWVIQDINLVSTTVMTSGSGWFISDMCDSQLRNVGVGLDLQAAGSNSNLYNGMTFNGGNSVVFNGSEGLRASNDALQINGDAWPNQFTDFFMRGGGKIVHSNVGIRIGGNVGGFSADGWDILENGTNLQIDQTLQGHANSQIFLGPNMFFDITTGGTGIGINLVDPGYSNSVMFLSGTWVASSSTACFVIGSPAQWIVNISGGTIFNCQGDALQVNSTNAQIYITGTMIQQNVGWGINFTAANPNLFMSGVKLVSNGGGNMSPNAITAASGSAVFSGQIWGNGGIFVHPNGTNSSFVQLYGGTSGTALFQAGSLGQAVIANNQGSQNTSFNDGANGTAFVIGNAGGTIANKIQVVPSQTGFGPSIIANGGDTNVTMRLTTQGAGALAVSAGGGVGIDGIIPTSCSSTGSGTGPSCAFDAGSNNSTGRIQITAGTSPGSSGTFTINLANVIVGSNSPVCLFTYNDTGAAWNTSALIPHMTSSSTSVITGTWNNSVALTAASVYKIDYHCFGK